MVLSTLLFYHTMLMRKPEDCLATAKMSEGCDTKRGLRQISEVGGHGASQESIENPRVMRGYELLKTRVSELEGFVLAG